MTRFAKTPTLIEQAKAVEFPSRASRGSLRCGIPSIARRRNAPTGAGLARGGLGRIVAVTTSLTPRESAARDAAALVATLRAGQATPLTTQLIDLGEHLERAVTAFHMEAIRFRAFTMSRLIKQHAGELPADVPVRMEAILHHLEAAGFHTRSVTA